MSHKPPSARETATTARDASTEPTSPWMDERGAAGRLGAEPVCVALAAMLREVARKRHDARARLTIVEDKAA